MMKKYLIISGGIFALIIIFLTGVIGIFNFKKDSNDLNISNIAIEVEKDLNSSFFDCYTIAVFGQTAYGLTSADFNKDGNMDFATSWADCPFTHATISIFYNDGNAHFIRKDVFVHPFYIKDLTSGDIDNDRDIDLVFTYNEVEWHNLLPYNTNGTVYGLFNDGNCIFGNAAMIVKRGTGIIGDPEGRINPKITSGDYDNDGDIELLVGDNSGKVEFYDNDGTGKFSTHGVIYDFGSCSWGLTSADFDGDNYTDFIVTAGDNEGYGHCYFKKNNCLPNCFSQDTSEIIGDILSLSASITPLDYNNNGDTDLIVGTLNKLFLFIKNDEKYTSLLIGELPYCNGSGEHLEFGGALTSADYNNDGKIDFITGGNQGVIRLFINKS